MARRRNPVADELDEAAAEAALPLIPAAPDRVGRSLRDLIDERFKDLLSLACEPPQLTKALEAAVKWYEVKQKDEGQQGWGTAFAGQGGRQNGWNRGH